MRWNPFKNSEKYSLYTGPRSSFDSESNDCDSEDESWYDDTGLTSSSDYDHERNQHFVHPPVLPTTQVQLLRITRDPFGKKSRVKGHFEVVNVADLKWKDYSALSYTWGEARSERDVRSIEIDGKSLLIRNNLWHFFRSASKEDLAMPIYVDAICTNQRDKQERGHQVKLMAEVYANVNLVHVWLGKAHPDHHGHLKSLHKQLSKASGSAWPIDAMVGLSYVCSFHFWTRLWVVQELLLAKNILVHFGKYRLKWDNLSHLQRKPLSESELNPQRKLNWWDVWIFSKPSSYDIQKESEERLSEGREAALRLFDHRGKWKK